MEHLLDCAIYLAVSGLVLFFAGRVLAHFHLPADRFPFRPFSFEDGGKIYERLGIRWWQDKLPDMSWFAPFLVPRKRLQGRLDPRLPQMIQETCVAEVTHVLLCVTGLYCMELWPGNAGAWLAGINALGNLLFIMIQRYNRPRLARLLARREHQTRRQEEKIYACADTEL